MCRETKICIIIFLSALLLLSAWGALHGQEDQWYLIRESELLSIEEYRRNSETEKLDWLSQAQDLRMRAGNLQAESTLLNSQLQSQREANRKLTQSFNEYEADRSLLMSRKDTRIAELEAESEKKDRLITKFALAVIALGLVVVAPLAAKAAKII
jgi:hypothetical protein